MAYGSGSGLAAQIWKAVRQLNPRRPAREADRRFILALVGRNAEDIDLMRSFLLGDKFSDPETARLQEVLKTFPEPLDDGQRREIFNADIVMSTAGTSACDLRLGERLFYFDPKQPQQSMKAVLGSSLGTELRLALGRRVPAFRGEIARRIIRDISMENAVFVVTTALGDVVPSPLEPFLGVTEAASDTVVLTANQVRMLFILGAVYGVEVGYVSQWKEISSIVGAAFGWRAIARELVAKIPFGGGLAPKGAIAYAGTTAVGEGLIFYFRTGRRMTRAEISQAFKDAYTTAAETIRAFIRESVQKRGTPRRGRKREIDGRTRMDPG